MSDKKEPGKSGSADFSLGPRQPQDKVFVQPTVAINSIGPRQPQAPAQTPETGKKK